MPGDDNVEQMEEETFKRKRKSSSRKCKAWTLVVVVVVISLIIGLVIGIFVGRSQKKGSTSETTSDRKIESEYRKYRFAGVTTETDVCSPIASNILVVHGGSAVDAMIAAAVCVGLVSPHHCGIGGGFFATIYDTPRSGGSKVVKTLLSREVAPLTADENMFTENPALSVKGGLAIGVPGVVAGYYELWKEYGRVEWRVLFRDSIQLLEDGIKVEWSLADMSKQKEEFIKADPNLGIFLREDGNVVKTGDTYRNDKLAATLRRIAADPFTFYNGSLAEDIVADIAEYDGIITKADLQSYQPKFKEPVSVSLQNGGYSLFAPPPPSSGAIIGLIMNILDGYDFSGESVGTTEDTILTYHRMAEAFKFAYAKRSQLGDEDFVDVANLLRNLTSDEYANGIRAQIDDEMTHAYKHYGPTFAIDEDSGTAHLNVLAPDGSAVALTTTINLGFGSKCRGSRTGILFNNEMDDFSVPGTSNYFGVPASSSNYIVPGKMPMSSMTPTILLDQSGDVRMITGAAGGTRITTHTSFVMANALWFGRDLKESTDTGRIHHQLLPDTIQIEDTIDKEIIDGLTSKKHKVEDPHFYGHVSSIVSDCHFSQRADIPMGNEECIEAVTDGRKGGQPDGL